MLIPLFRLDRGEFTKDRVWVGDELRGRRLLLSLSEALQYASIEILRFAQDDK